MPAISDKLKFIMSYEFKAYLASKICIYYRFHKYLYLTKLLIKDHSLSKCSMFTVSTRYHAGSSGRSQFGTSEQSVLTGLQDTSRRINDCSDSFPPFFLVQACTIC